MSEDSSGYYMCRVCDRLLQPLVGSESSLTRHSGIRHVLCRSCHIYYTPQGIGEHELLYHAHPCELCASRFTSVANLRRHKERIHRRYTCPLCPRRNGAGYYNGIEQLQIHVDTTHPGDNVYHCRQWSKAYTSGVNLSRHTAIAHNRECIYCDEYDDEDGPVGAGRRPRFATDAQLRQHIATSHNNHVCHFCGDMFRSNEGLYRHQMDHCRNRFKCVSCDREFDTIARLNAHMASYGSDIGACSSHTTPSLARHMWLWNQLLFRHKPWDTDVTHILGTGRVQTEISHHYRQQLRRQRARDGARDGARDDEQYHRRRAYRTVRDNYTERLKEVYRSNLRQYVNHTTVQADGQISRITVNLLNTRGFYEQVEAALRKIFNICRFMVPYNLLLAFGFLVYKMRTSEIEQYFVVDHLQRDIERKSLINQVPNIWLIRTVADEDQVIVDIRQTDFFDVLRDHMESEQYNFKIIRMTHMTAEMFPAIDCNIHNNVVSSQQQHQYVGRGGSTDLSDDDESLDEYDDDHYQSNPFILDEADVSCDDDEMLLEDHQCSDDDDRVGGGHDQHLLIRQYVQSKCRSRKSPVLVSLKKLLMSRHYSRPSGSSSQAYYRKLCFLHRLLDGDYYGVILRSIVL